ncbi:Aldose reductase [Entamoeba marina]
MTFEHPIPSFILNNGNHIPAVGLGTYLSEKNEVGNAVEIALRNGYKHIDCASIYFNEEEVGEALKTVFKEGKILREEVFITSKLWCDNKENEKEVEEACRESLKKLGLEYLDLYLVHQPVAFKKGIPEMPQNKEDFIDIPVEETWKHMERLVKLGLVKSIGVSNHTIPQLEKILKIATIKPAVNQVEFNVFFQQPLLVPSCKKHHIHITSFCPLGNNSVETRQNIPNVFDNEELKKLSNKYHKTIAQIIIRFIMQEGHSVIPKSVKEERIISNYQVMDWVLDENDVKIIESLNMNTRLADGDYFYKPMGISYEEFWSEPKSN